MTQNELGDHLDHLRLRHTLNKSTLIRLGNTARMITVAPAHENND